MPYQTKITSVIILSVIVVNAAKGPVFSACKKADTNLDSCLSRAIENGVKLLKDGLPEYHLKSLDPLAIDELTIGAGEGVVHLEQNYQDFSISGFTNLIVHNSTMDFAKKTLTFCVSCPLLTLKANYEINGKILSLPVHGKGPCTVLLENVIEIHNIQFEEVRNDDGLYFEPKTYSVKLLPERCQFQFDNLFNGNKLLGDNINKVLNQEWRAVFEDVANGYELAYAHIFLQYAKAIFAHINVNDLFLL